MIRKHLGELREELRSLSQSAGSNRSFVRLVEHAQFISSLHQWCRSSLSQAHLVEVASAVHSELEVNIEHLELLELPTDILELFPDWRHGSQDGFSAPDLGVSPPVLGAQQPIHLLRLQLSPFSVTLSAALLLIRSLLQTLDSSVKLHVAVEPGGNPEALAGVIGDFHPEAEKRVMLFEIETATVFAQDNARGVRSSSGEPGLLIPRSFRSGKERARDALDRKVERDLCGMPIYRSRLFWEGGNIVNDQSHCFIGIDHIRENMNRLGLTEEQVRQLFRAEFGESALFIGDSQMLTTPELKSGQAAFHIDLDVGLLGTVSYGEPPVALVASPESTVPSIKEVLATGRLVKDHFLDEQSAKELIEFEYRSYAEERHEYLKGYRLTLQEAGYRIIDMPDLRISPTDNLFSTRNLDFTYCNILCGQSQAGPTIYYLPYKIEVLDKLAEQRFKEAGCTPSPISNTSRLANLLMLFRGGLRCACSQVY